MDRAIDHAKDFLTWLLLGLGVTFSPEAWVGGMFLAMAGATFAIKAQPERDKVELWSVLGGAFIVAHVAAMVTFEFWPNWPVQLVMVLSGFFSRFIIRFFLRVAGLVEGKADQIVERAIDRVLPEDRGRSDE
jgi:hypothetical protein